MNETSTTNTDILVAYMRGQGHLPLADVYQIIQFALSVAKTDAGYYNEFLYKAAVIAGAAMTLAVDEDKPQFEGLDVLEVCEKIRHDGKLQTYFLEQKTKLANLMEVAMVEFRAAVAYNNSTVAGINAMMDTFSNMFAGFSDKVDGMVDNDQVKKVLEIASAYGMDNKTE